MRVYSIFNIKKEHRAFIYGRERMLLEMVSTIEQTAESSVGKELRYICEPITREFFWGKMSLELQKRFPHMNLLGDYIIFEHSLKGHIELRIHPCYIEAICEGSRMLDLDLFQSLGQMNDSFLAFNKKEMECGWLKPVKYYSY